MMTDKCFVAIFFLLHSSSLANASKRAFTLKPPTTNSPIHGCGVPVVQPTTRNIVGGTPARVGSWPWSVLIVNDLGIPSGSGVILHPNVILTTAQIFETPEYSTGINLKYWRIYTGKYNIASTDPFEKFYNIDRVIIHPNFNFTSSSNDIALVITSQPITYNDHTGPACLSEPGHIYTVGELCYMARWGKTSSTGIDEVLTQLEVQVLAHSECSNEYPNFYNSRLLKVCVGYQNQTKGWCTDDVGSPLMCKDRNAIWYIQGLASQHGEECKHAGKPSVCEDVSMYSDWIKKKMADAHFPYIY